MPRLFLTTTGDVRVIGNYGTATEFFGVEVPDEVAAEFEGRDGFRVERDAPAPRLGRKRKQESPETLTRAQTIEECAATPGTYFVPTEGKED